MPKTKNKTRKNRGTTKFKSLKTLRAERKKWKKTIARITLVQKIANEKAIELAKIKKQRHDEHMERILLKISKQMEEVAMKISAKKASAS